MVRGSLASDDLAGISDQTPKGVLVLIILIASQKSHYSECQVCAVIWSMTWHRAVNSELRIRLGLFCGTSVISEH